MEDSHSADLREVTPNACGTQEAEPASPSLPTALALPVLQRQQKLIAGTPCGALCGEDRGAAGAPARAGRGGERWPGAGRPLLAAQRHSGPDRAP